ncbi:AEC family transporter [Marinobacter sp. R17]|uniref:AEC family transporter n=1 Tax=Marinobacter sp. R17 TaxID=2484250 RepID=UPI000F4CD07E|nr:AEC family transporter [Marinobacter sp. R17]ROT98802.1 AEC family transporter [Marinobacter sp. R17]
MLSILSTTAPIFIIIALGFIAVRTRLFPAEAVAGLGRFVIYFALPALIFSTVSQMAFSEVIDRHYLLVYGLGSMLAFVAGIGLSKALKGDSLSQGAIKGMGMSMSNSAFVGLPVLLLAFDDPPTNAFAMNLMIENMVVLPVALIVMEFSQGRGNSESLGAIIRPVAGRVVRNPLVIAIVAGVLASLANVEVPQVLQDSLDMLGRTSATVALFFVGASLVGTSLRGNIGNIGEIGGVALGKLTLHPLMMVLLIWLLPDFDPQLQTAAILLAAMPMASVYPIIGSLYGYRRLTSSILLAGTVLSFFSISIALAVLF